MNRPAVLSFLFLLSVAIVGSASTVAAQDLPRATVFIVDDGSLSESVRADLQEGLEMIVMDYGDFEVVENGVLLDALERRDQRYLQGCALDVGCYSDILGVEVIDFVVLTEVVERRGEFDVYILSGNLHDGSVASEQEGNLPDPSETLFLLVPMFEALGALTDLGIEVDPDRPDVSGLSGRDTSDDDDRDDDDDLNDDDDDDPLAFLDSNASRTGPSDTNFLSIGLIAGGGALVATGLIFWMLADDTQEEIQSGAHEWEELLSLQDTGDSQATVGNISLIAGAVILATGVVFELTGIGAPGDSDDDDFDFDDWSYLQLNTTRTGTFLHYQLSF